MIDRAEADFNTLKMTSHTAQSIPFHITSHLVKAGLTGEWGGGLWAHTHTHAYEGYFSGNILSVMGVYRNHLLVCGCTAAVTELCTHTSCMITF